MNPRKKKKGKNTGDVEIRTDLENAEAGKDLAYLNEFPQRSVDEGVKGGIPPPKKKKR